MNDLDLLEKVHRSSDDINFPQVWKEATFVFDSNVLLDLYRLPNSATDDLINLFKSSIIHSKSWIPKNTILEFYNNRMSAISDQKNKFSKVDSLIDKAISGIDDSLNELQVEIKKLMLEKRHSTIKPRKFLTDKNFESSKRFLIKFKSELEKLNKLQPDVHDKDEIMVQVKSIFKDRIGAGLSTKEISEIYKDGEIRFAKKIPPGYKDDDKKDDYIFRDFSYSKKYGDLILWKEIIEKCKSDKLKFVLLVTGDVKEDWWEKRRGKTIGPRKELLNEIYANCPDLEVFHMYDTSTFLRYAKDQLKANVKSSTIKEAKDLIEVQSKPQDNFLVKQLKDIQALIPCTYMLGKSVKRIKHFNLKEDLTRQALIETASLAGIASLDRYVGVQAKPKSAEVSLQFRYRLISKTRSIYEENGISRNDLESAFIESVDSIELILEPYRIKAEFILNESYGYLMINIPSDLIN